MIRLPFLKRLKTLFRPARTFTVTLDADGFISSLLIDGGGKPPVKVERVGGKGLVKYYLEKSSDETFAEIIRAADALYRLAGAK